MEKEIKSTIEKWAFLITVLLVTFIILTVFIAPTKEKTSFILSEDLNLKGINFVGFNITIQEDCILKKDTKYYFDYEFNIKEYLTNKTICSPKSN